MVAFDADPKPSLAHLFEPNSGFPQGFAQVAPLSEKDRDSLSLSTLRNAIFRVDQMSVEDPTSVEILQQKDIVLKSGFHGNRYIFNVRLANSDVFFTVNQTALVDPATRMLYLFLIGCEAHCYLTYQKTIDRIVESWTVKEH
jgi:hypothetical protein